MYIEELIIINYKSCRKVHATFAKDEPNILIGVNDCGKSSLLKAIGLLLSSKAAFNFPTVDKVKNDFSNARLEQSELEQLFIALRLPPIPYNGKQSFILGKLKLEIEELQEECIPKYSAHLQWAIENRTEDSIWIMKSFNEDDNSITDYIITKDALENEKPIKLYTQTAKALKEKADELSISKQRIENENKVGRFKNIEYVTAIYKQFELKEHWVSYSIKDEKNFFPEYHYLDWNVTLDQLQQFAKSAINNKISTHLDKATRFANHQAKKAQEIVNGELGNFTKQFAVDFPNISNFKSNIIFTLESRLTDLLVNKANTHGDIHLDSQGEGVKRQIWFALIKWSALNSIDSKIKAKKFIWCFDEPETHLYPRAQRELFEIIKEVSLNNIQTVISTHSTVFIDRANFKRITKYELNEGYTATSGCEDVADIFDALQIRNSDFLFYDKFLVIEGDTEEILIPHLFKLYTNSTLQEKGIKIINLGGKDKRQQNHFILTKLLQDFRKTNDSIVYILDSDARFEMTQKELESINYFLVGKQDIEDSISSKAWADLINTEFNDLEDFSFEIAETDIEELKSQISATEKLNSNQKFYPRLRTLLKQNMPVEPYRIDDKLPSKGKASAYMLCKYITVDDIDKKIQKAFTHILS